jgi:hypothetical protein
MCLRVRSALDPALATKDVLGHHWLSEVKYEIKCLSQRHLRLEIYCVVWAACRC